MKLKTTAAAAALATLLACGSDEGSLAHSLVATCLQYQQRTVRVFRTDAEWQAAHREQGKTAPAVDFSQYMIAGHYDGPGSHCTTFSVQDVSVRDDDIVIAATRHESTLPCILILSYPQLTVQLPRRDEPVRFDIREIRGESEGPAKACP